MGPCKDSQGKLGTVEGGHHLIQLSGQCLLHALVAESKYLKGGSLKTPNAHGMIFSKAGSLCRCKKHLLRLKFTNSFNSVIRQTDTTMYLSLECLCFGERMKN